MRILLLVAALLGSAQAQTPSITLERLNADPPLAGRLPVQAKLSPGGGFVSFLRAEAHDSQQLALWLQPAGGGAARRLVGAAELLGGGPQKLSEAEAMALERRRVTQRGITGYSWCGQGDAALLFPLSGELYLARLQVDGVQVQKIPGSVKEQPAQDARCDPEGRQLAFARAGQLWVQRLDGSAPRALTADGGGTVAWGLAEFIAAEELDRHEGYWWRPDGKALLALRVDEARVPLKVRASIGARGTSTHEQRYPAAGELNAEVTAWVLNLDGSRRALPLPFGSEYLARAGWFRDGTPWLQTLPRDQTRLVLTEYGAQPRTLIEERDAAWVETHSDLRELPDGRLLWPSEASGVRQLLRVDRASGRAEPLTRLPEPVHRVVCAHAGGVVVEAPQQRARARALLQVDWQGAVQPLAVQGWNEASADEACARLLVRSSQPTTPPALRLLNRAGGPSLELAGDAPDPLVAQVLRAGTPVTLTAADGVTPLNASWHPPAASAAPGARPLLVLAYGGPGTVTVAERWAGDALWVARWQQRGYGVLRLDTRGMDARDRAYTRAHHRAFGQVEVADLFAAVRQFAAQTPAVDARRIGFYGWSYGGYLAARAMLDADTPFAAAVAGAPVTDWTLYDTAYTERYLGLPPNPAYAQADLPSRAGLLTKPLLLVHGTADDNVLLEHSLRLLDALQAKANPHIEFMAYPGKTHAITGKGPRQHLQSLVERFFERTLAQP